MWTALLGDEVLNLESMTAGEKWDLRADMLARGHLLCRGCKTPVHTRLLDGDQPNPLMVFAHNPHGAELCQSLGFHTDESREHHTLKAKLAKSARAAGWTAELEVYSGGCRTDVLATSPKGKHWALEAQLAALPLSDAIQRSQRYESEFERVTWTHTRRRDWTKRIPAVRVDDETTSIVIDGLMTDPTGQTRVDDIPLAEVIPRILTLDITYLTDEDLGFYVDLKAQGSKPGIRQAAPSSSSHSGDFVRECSRTPAELVADGAYHGRARGGAYLCATCRRDEPRWLATRESEQWLSCNRCREQAKSRTATVTFQKLRET